MCKARSAFALRSKCFWFESKSDFDILLSVSSCQDTARDTTRLDSTRLGSTRHDTTRHDTTWLVSTRHDTFQNHLCRQFWTHATLQIWLLVCDTKLKKRASIWILNSCVWSSWFYSVAPFDNLYTSTPLLILISLKCMQNSVSLPHR